MPVGLDAMEMEQIDQMVIGRRRLAQRETLFSAGEPFKALFAVRSGVFKTKVSTPDGREQVTGFQIAGDMLGLDGIVDERYQSEAVALEDSEVCVIPFDRIETVARQVDSLQRHVHRLMSGRIVLDQTTMVVLGTLRAEERVATFLLNLLDRLHERGFSQSEMVLRMTREEIGSYLGLTLETVSRTLSRLASEGLIEVQQRQIKVLDDPGLRRRMHHPAD